MVKLRQSTIAAESRALRDRSGAAIASITRARVIRVDNPRIAMVARSLAPRGRSSFVHTMLFKVAEVVALVGILALQNTSLSVQSLAQLGVVLSTYGLIGSFLYGPIGTYVTVNFARLLRWHAGAAVLGLNFICSMICGVIGGALLATVPQFAGLPFSSTEILAIVAFLTARFLLMGQTNIGVLLFTHRHTAGTSLAASIAGMLFVYGIGRIMPVTLTDWILALTVSYLFGYGILAATQMRIAQRTRAMAPAVQTAPAPFGGWHAAALIALPAFRWAQTEFPRITAARSLPVEIAGSYFATSQILLVGFGFSEMIIAMYYSPILAFLNGRSRTDLIRAFSLDAALAYGCLTVGAALPLIVAWPAISEWLRGIAPHLAEMSPFVVFAILIGELARQTTGLILSTFIHLRRYKRAVYIGIVPAAAVVLQSLIVHEVPRAETLAAAVLVGNLATAVPVIVMAGRGRLSGPLRPRMSLWLAPAAGAVLAGLALDMESALLRYVVGGLCALALIAIGGLRARRVIGLGTRVTRRASRLSSAPVGESL